jgi:hypothetical protein
MHRVIRVKRGSPLGLDDAKVNNLIFVGSLLENLSLLEIPGTQEFLFRRIDSGPRKGDPGLVSLHPQPGEPTEFHSSPLVGDDLKEDYGVIALLRGLDSDHSVLILAGNTTMSTQAAVEFCHPNSIDMLLRRMSGSANGHLKPFEAVIHVKV